MEELVYNVHYIDNEDRRRTTQFKIEKIDNVFQERIDLFNLILSAKEELNIKKIDYIELEYYD